MSQPEIRVADLPPDAERDDLVGLFATFGEILSVELFRPQEVPPGSPTARVTMRDWSEAHYAVSCLHNHFFGDQRIQVTLAEAADPTPSDPFAAERAFEADLSGLSGAIQSLNEMAREEERAMPTSNAKGISTHALQAQALRYAAARLTELAAKRRVGGSRGGAGAPLEGDQTEV